MADSSFDIVSKIDRQEVDNALSQAAREIATALRLQGHRRRRSSGPASTAIEISRQRRRPGHAPSSTCSRRS